MLGVHRRRNRAADDFNLAFPAGRIAAAGGVDVNAGLHSRLEEILPFVNKDVSVTRMKRDLVFPHDQNRFPKKWGTIFRAPLQIG